MAGTTTQVAAARAKMAYRTIPDTTDEDSVATANGTYDLTPYAGKWIFLNAEGGNITIKRGAVAITGFGRGAVIKDGEQAEFYVDPTESLVLNHWGSAACVLNVAYDSRS